MYGHLFVYDLRDILFLVGLEMCVCVYVLGLDWK